MDSTSVKPNNVCLSKVRNHLKECKVFLWEKPYILDDGSTSEPTLLTLSETISNKLNISTSDVMNALKYLQSHSIFKKVQNEKFKETGIATLFLKGDKSIIKDELTYVESKLDISGEQLSNLITEKIGNKDIFLKLICRGKIIKPDLVLYQQNVTHNKDIFCMVVQSDNKNKVREMEEIIKLIESTKKGAGLISNNRADAYFQLQNQDGVSLEIPQVEKSAIVTGLALHKRGVIYLSKKQYKSALLFLLEADEVFKSCSSELLNSVDNYAILNLDICWCYLELKNIEALPDIEERLKSCEVCFNKSYGNDMERLIALKGSTGEEAARYVRLYTLQGVAAYCNNKFEESLEFLKKAENLISSLKLDENQIARLLEFGFELTESKKALRACKGDLNKAVEFAMENKQKREKIKKDEAEKKKIAKFGKCANGKNIDFQAHNNMVKNFNFDEYVAAEALKQCNNDIALAVQAVQGNYHLLQQAAERFKIKKNGAEELIRMGFDERNARSALRHFKEDIRKAADFLLQQNGLVPPEWLNALRESASEQSLLNSEDEEAVHELLDACEGVDEQYEDILALEEEQEYICKYLALITSAP